MHVVATAGHVDHGKSALVRALTGIEPDRWAEERRRGLTIDLGFAWMTLPSSDVVAFVDVPGHERFITNMLAGVGPVPAVLLVVAADEGWMPQTAEHVRVLDALGVRHGLLVVTKSDLAAPQPVVDDVRERLGGTGLDGVDAVAVSASTGAGLDELRAALAGLVHALPAPDAHAPVRLWVDRSFTIAGAGTVVTGTLAAGTVRVGDRLHVAGSDATVVVRGVQSRGEEHESITATARVALNLRGVERHQVPRGSALVTPGRWVCVDEVDVLADGWAGRDVVVHLGSAAVPARARRLGVAGLRVQLDRPLPMHYGDRLLVREPSSRAVVGATVADLDPKPLLRRGDAAAAGSALCVPASVDDEVARRGVVEACRLVASGLPGEPDAVRVDARWVHRPRWEEWRAALPGLVASAAGADGVAVDEVRERLGVPDAALVAALVAAEPTLEVRGGSVRRRDADPDLAAIAGLLDRLAARPLDAPDGDEVRDLDRAALARGVRAGRLLHLGKGIYVGAEAGDRAVRRLSGLPQPFTVGDATRALESTRRVVVPLLEHLDAARRTRRLPDGTRFLVGGPG